MRGAVCQPNRLGLAFVLLVVALHASAEKLDGMPLDGTKLLALVKPLGELRKGDYEKTPDFQKRSCAETYKVLGAQPNKPVLLEGYIRDKCICPGYPTFPDLPR